MKGPHPLPPEVPESSGVAPGGDGPDVLWTHNDSGWDPELFAVDRQGRLLATVWVEGAGNLDWEDLAAGPCPDGGRCLYIADTGDNRLVRDTLVVYRVPEPGLDDDRTRRADSLLITLPDGPRDIEALFLLPAPDEGSEEMELHLVTKGRAGPVEQYRHPGPLRAGEAVEVERIARLTDRRPLLPRMVTGADATSNGSLVAVRTYEDLRFFRPEPEGALAGSPVAVVNLRPLREPQGEAVAFSGDDGVVLTSEAGPGGELGILNQLRCRLTDPG